MLWLAAILAVIAGFVIPFYLLDPLQSRKRKRLLKKLASEHLTYAFFHPDALSGGGGERVLWQAVAAMQSKWTTCRISIYIRIHSLSNKEVAAKVKSQFNIDIDLSRIKFIFLHYAKWIEAKRYPRLTLLAQSIGSMVPGIEALMRYRAEVFLDTVGFAFLNPLAKFCGCKVVSYVHYPTISSDMLGKVTRGEADFNNSAAISKSAVLTTAKLLYYRAFAWLYGFVGSFADVVMVNSTWTQNHVNDIWRVPKRTTIVYPPCDTTSLLVIPFGARKDAIVSVAQFRPEKAHRLQLEAFADLLKKFPEYKKGGSRPVQLILVGGCRNDADKKLLEGLEEIAKAFGPDHDILFEPNAEYSELLSLLSTCKIGLHTMTDEHFGISILEYMAAGVVALAHDSGGPKSDIIVPYKGKITGFRASTVAEYSEKFREILTMPEKELDVIRKSARDHVVENFSSGTFETKFVECISTSR